MFQNPIIQLIIPDLISFSSSSQIFSTIMDKDLQIVHVHSNSSMTCVTLTNMTKYFVETDMESYGFMSHYLPLFELQIGLIFIFSHLFHLLLKRFGITLFVASMLTGIILGDTFLGRYEYMKYNVYTVETRITLRILATLSINIFMFLSAVKMDVGMVLTTGKKAMSIGVACTLSPFIVGAIYTITQKDGSFADYKELVVILEVIQIQSITPFSVVSYTIDQLKLMNSELGRLGLSAALVADVYSIMIAFIASFFKDGYKGGSKIYFIAFATFLAAAAFIIRPIMLWFSRQTPPGTSVKSGYVSVIIVLSFLTGLYFFEFRQGPYIGPLILGFTVPAGSPLGTSLVEKFETISYGFLLPILTAISMLNVDLFLIVSAFTDIQPYMALIVALFVVKLTSCFIPSLFCKLPLIDSVALALILTCEGVIELTAIAVLKKKEVFSQELLSLMALFILFSSTFSPVLVKYLYDPSRKYAGYQDRNISCLKPQAELRIVTCIKKPVDIFSVKKLLRTTYPTKESPIAVYVLHLIELMGRTTPIFITHRKHKPVSNPISQNIILSFENYQQHNWNAVSVNTFTAMSPLKCMHEDICTLALDKLASLIVIPFHPKWTTRAATESESLNRFRNLTRKVLERTPCSVGIFFDRSKYNQQHIKASMDSYQSLCIIFLGGSDDREALALARRMAKNSTTTLTILHLISEEQDNDSSNWEEKTLNTNMIADVKQSNSESKGSTINYQDHKVKDGPESALLIHKLANDYDLFIVGRRDGIESPQTTGLSEWIELPELGVMGDFLVSDYLRSEASVLVVQKQKQKKYLE
ncbi:cation/H(+) antiporter 4-like [Mercurialis annua]|uniref:cation/H(+) antiporter 4-like n=1 Tax=Mercurialis annua TaxID=3986 RepID=UPI0024AEB996|nr:cation/H(+) antiporter 4-like [Mercurialis annua]